MFIVTKWMMVNRDETMNDDAWYMHNIYTEYIYKYISYQTNIHKLYRMVDFTFPLQLKGTCLSQKKCFALDLVYYMLGIA